MEIILNGKNKNIKKSLTLQDLLKEFNLDQNRVAVEKNNEIIHKEKFESEKIVENDRIEIVSFVGGG